MTASEQARADAIADAETLRRHAEKIDTSSLDGFVEVDRANNRKGSVAAHLHLGLLFSRECREWIADYRSAGQVEESRYYAELAARAAFRAVPGLRGEESHENR